MLKCTVNNLKQTQKLAKKFAKTLVGGEVVLLNGDLGAGKTTFTKFVAKALGVKDEVTSPTFTIMKQYQGKKLKLLHFDMYRIESADESIGFGFDDYIKNRDYGAVIFIEWSERVTQLIEGESIVVDIKRVDENKRLFSIERVQNEISRN